MVNILNQITVGDLRIAVLSAAPNTGSGIAMELGSLAMVEGQAGIYQKTGSGATDWTLSTIDAAQLGLDLAALDSRLDTLELDPVTKSYVDTQISAETTARETAVDGLQDQIDTEKGRIDAILLASDADKDSFAEIVQLINSVDTTNDNAFASYVLSNDAALSAETLARENADDALQSAIDAEALARETADQGFQTSITALEAKEFIYEYEDLASFPATGEPQRIYVDKSTDFIYRYEEVIAPASYDWIVGSGGDFATLHDALASTSVLDDHKIKVLNGTYQSDVSLNINKKVLIYGESREGVILQTSASTSAPVTMINVSAGDETGGVLLKDITIKHRKTNNTSVEAAVVASGGGFPQTRIANFVMDNCLVEHVEFGVVLRCTNFRVSGNTISYMGPTNSTRRHLGLYGVSGTAAIMNNVFKDNAASGSVRAIAITSTTGTNPNETNEGILYVHGNTQDGPMAQFISQDNWQGTTNSYLLYITDNIVNETSAFVSFFGTSSNFGNILNSVNISGNTLSNNHETSTGLGKGLIGIDGSGSSLSFRSSALAVHSSANTLGQLLFRADYLEVSGSSGSIVGYKPSVFNAPLITLDETLEAIPDPIFVPSAGGGTTAEYIRLSPDDALVKLDGSRAMTGALDMGGFKVTNAAEPTSSSDLVTKGYVDTNLGSETSARQSADTGLQNQINTEKGRIDSILLAADADKDSFAEIVSLINSVDTTNDNAFASYVLSNNAALAAETLARQNADNALDTRLDVLELDPVTKTYVDSTVAATNINVAQTRYVAKSGSDSTGTGSFNKPFASITAALNSITDASPTNRYVIRVASGTYNDASIALKANVFIVGDMKNAVRLNGAFSLASDFTGSADHRSGISNAVVLGAVNFNWATVTSSAGKIFLNECIFSSTVTMYGHNSSIAQAQIQSCEFFGIFTVSGINIGIHSNNTHFAETILNQHPNSGMATILAATGGKLGKITLTTTVNDFNRRCSLFAFAGTYIDELKVDGASSYADLSESSVPRDPAKLTNPNNGNIVYLNSTVPYKTNDRSVGQPGRQYLYNFSYVHASTESDLYLISMGNNYAPDSAGRSVHIESDSWGLNSNVNGGDINLTTAETSGTGVRGKIKLTGREFEVVVSGVQYNMLASSGSTTGTATSLLAAMSVADNTSELMKFMVTGVDSTTYDSVCFEKTARVKKVGGTLTLQAVQSDYTSKDASLADVGCDVVLDSGTVCVQVQGVTGATINWKCVVQKVK